VFSLTMLFVVEYLFSHGSLCKLLPQSSVWE